MSLKYEPSWEPLHIQPLLPVNPKPPTMNTNTRPRRAAPRCSTILVARDLALPQSYLTQSIFKVVLQKSISTQAVNLSFTITNMKNKLTVCVEIDFPHKPCGNLLSTQTVWICGGVDFCKTNLKTLCVR